MRLLCLIDKERLELWVEEKAASHSQWDLTYIGLTVGCSRVTNPTAETGLDVCWYCSWCPLVIAYHIFSFGLGACGLWVVDVCVDTRGLKPWWAQATIGGLWQLPQASEVWFGGPLLGKVVTQRMVEGGACVKYNGRLHYFNPCSVNIGRTIFHLALVQLAEELDGCKAAGLQPHILAGLFYFDSPLLAAIWF